MSFGVFRAVRHVDITEGFQLWCTRTVRVGVRKGGGRGGEEKGTKHRANAKRGRTELLDRNEKRNTVNERQTDRHRQTTDRHTDRQT